MKKLIFGASALLVMLAGLVYMLVPSASEPENNKPPRNPVHAAPDKNQEEVIKPDTPALKSEIKQEPDAPVISEREEQFIPPVNQEETALIPPGDQKAEKIMSEPDNDIPDTDDASGKGKKHLNMILQISPEGQELVSASYHSYAPKRSDRLKGKDTHLLVVRGRHKSEIARTGVCLDGMLYWDAPSGDNAETGELTGGAIRQETFAVASRFAIGDEEAAQVDCYKLPQDRVRFALLNTFNLEALVLAWSIPLNPKDKIQ